MQIMLADAHRLMRKNIRNLIAKENDMTVIAEVEDERKLVDCALEKSPDILLLNVFTPRFDGLKVAKNIIKRAPKIRIIALSFYSDKRFVASVLNAGIKGYLTKDCIFEEMVYALRQVYRNNVYVSPNILNES